MKETRVTMPELGLIAATRVALGVGVGLLLADRFPPDQRRAIGWTLLGVGALTTIPLAYEVLGGSRLSSAEDWSERSLNGPRPEAEGRPSEWRVAAQT